MKVKLGLLISTILVIFCVLVSLSYAIEEESIVGIWRFNEGEGDVATDFSGNGHDGEFVGELEWVEGKFDSPALLFPKEKDPLSYVEIPHKDSLTLITWSITAWIKMPSKGSQVILAKTHAFHIQWNYCLRIGSLGEPSADLGLMKHNGGPFTGVAKSGIRIESDKWYHIAGTYDQNFRLTIYVDGNLKNEATYDDPPDTNTNPVAIGAYSPSNTAGEIAAANDWGSKSVVIDEVGLFNSALSSDEIQLVMTKGLKIASYAVSPAGKLATAWGQIKLRN